MQRITKDTPIRLVRDNKLLSARVCNGLMRGGCETVEDVLDLYNNYRLVEVRDMGPTALGLVKDFLRDYKDFDPDDDQGKEKDIKNDKISISVTSKK